MRLGADLKIDVTWRVDDVDEMRFAFAGGQDQAHG